MDVRYCHVHTHSLQSNKWLGGWSYATGTFTIRSMVCIGGSGLECCCIVVVVVAVVIVVVVVFVVVVGGGGVVLFWGEEYFLVLVIFVYHGRFLKMGGSWNFAFVFHILVKQVLFSLGVTNEWTERSLRSYHHSLPKRFWILYGVGSRSRKGSIPSRETFCYFLLNPVSTYSSQSTILPNQSNLSSLLTWME